MPVIVYEDTPDFKLNDDMIETLQIGREVSIMAYIYLISFPQTWLHTTGHHLESEQVFLRAGIHKPQAWC